MNAMPNPSANISELPGLVAEFARRSVNVGLNQGTSGNVSARSRSGFLITPSGLDMTDLAAADMVPVAMDGQAAEGMKPSSEWRFHRDIYAAFPEAGAIVHAHSPFAVALACLRRDIPPFHYMVAMAGGRDIRCARYATFGSQALSDAVLEALGDRRACLMANHGLVAWGRSLAGALALAVEVEALCGQYLRCLQVGEPVLLSGAEMAEVIEKFKDYGNKA
jgi:L-fuculose-phosphate aldolase